MSTETPESEGPEIIDLATMEGIPILTTRDRQLSVKLTEPEWVEFVESQVAAIIEMTALEATEKARRSVWNGQHKARESEVQRLVGIVDARAEDRQVEVITYAILDGPPDSNVALTVRTDTGEVLSRRGLRGEEVDRLSQQPLAFTAEPAPADGAPAVEPVTIKGVVFADPMAAMAFVNDTDEEGLKAAGLKGRACWYIQHDRPHASLQALAEILTETVGIDEGEVFEAIRKTIEPVAELPPKGARDLVRYIERGRADAGLEALKADSRKSVAKALEARRAVLAEGCANCDGTGMATSPDGEGGETIGPCIACQPAPEASLPPEAGEAAPVTSP